MKKTSLKMIIYFVPIIGTLKLLKRIRSLEQKMGRMSANEALLAEVYESRIQKIYDKVADLLLEGKLKI
jgi:hypothetical protein